MGRRGLQTAAACLTACTFLGSLAVAHVASATEASSVGPAFNALLVSTASTVPQEPVAPSRGGPHGSRGAAIAVAANEPLKSHSSSGVSKALSAVGDAYGSGSSNACGSVAVDDPFALHAGVVDARGARAPPSS
jgi:hypothetical protein